jgi:DNA-binding NarL/FixJ family response regulator
MTLGISAEQNSVSDDHSLIVVLDCHPLARSCFARVLRNEFRESVVVEIDTAQHFDVFVGQNVSLVALNIGPSTITDGRLLNDLAYFHRALPGGPLMLLTQMDESAISDAMIAEVARYGVRGCITDSASVEITLAAFRLVMAGGVYFPRSMFVEHRNWAPTTPNISALQTPCAISDPIGIPSMMERTNVALTERERQVLATLLRGLSNKVIAHELNLSQNTVKSHISHIMRKLRATNRTEAVVLSQYVSHAINGDATTPKPEAQREN